MDTHLSKKVTRCTLLDAVGAILMAIASVSVCLDGIRIALLPATVPLSIWAVWHRWGWQSGLLALALDIGLVVAVVVVWCGARKREGR